MSKKPKSNPHIADEQKIQDLQMQLGRNLIDRDEGNQRWALAKKIGDYLMRPVRFWRKLFPGSFS